MLKAAVIGCGMIAGIYEELETPSIYSHGKAYFYNGEITQIAFVDKSLEKSRKLAQKFQGVAYPNLHTLLHDFQPDCISVCTPDDHHFSILRQIFNNSKGVKLIFTEKPVCTTRTELDSLKEMERWSGIKIIVHHNRRFDPAHQRLRSLILRGALGAFIRGDIDYYGGWRHLGVHIVDILQFFFGEPLIPKAMTYACDSKYANDPTLHVEAEINGGPLRMTGYNEADYQIIDTSLKFKKGQITIEDFGKTIKVYQKIVNREKENVLELDLENSGLGMTNPIVSAIKTIVEYLKTENEQLLEPFSLEQADSTMNTLWKGANIYDT